MKKGSAGGKATAKILRAKALLKYYSNPNICENCGSVIVVKPHEKVAWVRRKRFCDQKCSGIYHNTKRNDCKSTLKVKIIGKTIPCDVCGSIKCETCDKTKGELFEVLGYFKARSWICKHARKVFSNHDISRSCVVCGYNIYIEICHIKAVAIFDDNSLIREINSIENLVALCPNHHKEYDLGILKLKAGRLLATS